MLQGKVVMKKNKNKINNQASCPPLGDRGTQTQNIQL